MLAVSGRVLGKMESTVGIRDIIDWHNSSFSVSIGANTYLDSLHSRFCEAFVEVMDLLSLMH